MPPTDAARMKPFGVIPGTTMIQFYVKYLGFQEITVLPRQGAPADEIARHAVNAAMEAFDKKWMGTNRKDLHVTGLTDGIRIVDARDVPHD